MMKILDCLRPTNNVKTHTVMDIVEKTGLNHVTVVRYLSLLAMIQKEVGVFIIDTHKTPIVFSIPTMKLIEAQLRTSVLDRSYSDLRKLLGIE